MISFIVTFFVIWYCALVGVLTRGLPSHFCIFYIYIYIHIHIYIHTYIHTYIHIHICIYIYIHIYIYICVCVYKHTHTHTHTHMYFIPLSILRQVSSLFQSEFSTECDPVLSFQIPVSPSSCFCRLPRLPVTSILPCIFPSITCLRRQLLCKL